MNEGFVTKLEKHKKYFFIKLNNEKKSKNTIDSYDRNLNKFFDFLYQYDEELSFEELREQDIFEYIEYRSNISEQQHELSVSSKNQMISNLKKFFSYIERNERKPYDFDKVFSDIKIKKIVSTPKGLETDKYIKLINYFDVYKVNHKNKFIAYRNVLLIKLMLFSGARVSEAINIRYNQIENCSKNTLYKISVIGKGSKSRYIYIEKSLIDNELNFLLGLNNISSNDYIATTIRNKQLDRVQLYKAANIIYKEAGLDGVSEVHILRHTYAKKKVHEIPINILQKLLGHSVITTTSIYTKATDQMVEDSLG